MWIDVGGPWSGRIARLILGLVVVVALRVGLAVIFPREPEVVGWFFRALRHAVIGLWAIWLAPQVFIRLEPARSRATRKW